MIWLKLSRAFVLLLDRSQYQRKAGHPPPGRVPVSSKVPASSLKGLVHQLVKGVQ